jgi:tripartite-type tricarboxylate transporter receptor subunit TctC
MAWRRTFFASLAMAVVLVAVLTAHSAWAQTRTIRFIVPFGPGSSIDILARLIAEQIGRTQGATVTVENRLGAGSIIATEAVAGAAPDGNTILFVTNPFVINPQLRKVNYDAIGGFEPICHLTNLPNIYVVNATSPYRTLADLVGAAREKPATLTLASVGPGTGSHIAFEHLKQLAKVNMTFVPYQGTPPAINALLGEHVTAVLAGYADVVEQVEAGKLRALAVATRSRIDLMPSLPTVIEAGYPDYEASIWYGATAPAKTPKQSVVQMAAWMTAAMQEPDVKAKLAIQALYPVGACGGDFAAFLRKQYDEYGRVIREANIKVD